MVRTGSIRTLLSLRTLPDLQAALEGLVLFLLLVLGGVALVAAKMLPLAPPGFDRAMFAQLSVITFFVPALVEEVVFRSWLGPKTIPAAALSLAAFVAWHPLQTALGFFWASPAFLTPGFLIFAAATGLACTVSRMRSGSIWPAVAIHWGIAMLWQALFSGGS